MMVGEADVKIVVSGVPTGYLYSEQPSKMCNGRDGEAN